MTMPGTADPQAWQDRIQALLDLQSAGKGDEAIDLMGQYLTLAPPNPSILNALGMAALRLGQLTRGIDCLGRSLSVNPQQANILALHGAALFRAGRALEALAPLDRALALHPRYADAYFDRGCVFHALRRLPEALSDFDRAIALAADNAASHTSRGAVLHELGERARALQAFDSALRLEPSNVRALVNRGALLHEQGRVDEALQSCRRAVAIDPNDGEARFNLGAVLDSLCERDEAAVQYRHALALAPGHVDAAFNLSLIHLTLGKFEDGWRGFEWRWDSKRMKADAWWRDSPRHWRGETALDAGTILLVTEQGLGDTLQFCRYASLLAERGARVIVEAEEPLCGLMQTLPGVTAVIAKGEPRPAYDFVCPMLSLPLALGTTAGNIPARVPYLHARPQAVAAWAARLGPVRRKRVGLVWRGGFRPLQPETWRANERRNIPLVLLRPFADVDVDFVSLQKGPEAEAELAQLRARGWGGPVLADHTALLHDFSDTAALVQNLDLVISVDTSTAHLAAALGKPVWLMNRFDTCWRWMLDRRDSPWYPTLTVYRQRAPGDWAGVVAAVRTDLQGIATGNMAQDSA